MDDTRLVVTGQSQAHRLSVGSGSGFLDLLCGHVHTLVAQDQQVGEEFVDPVVGDLNDDDAGEGSGDFGQLAALRLPRGSADIGERHDNPGPVSVR